MEDQAGVKRAAAPDEWPTIPVDVSGETSAGGWSLAGAHTRPIYEGEGARVEGDGSRARGGGWPVEDGGWRVREAEPPAYDGEASDPDQDPPDRTGGADAESDTPSADAPGADPDPDSGPADPATYQDRIVTLEDRMAEMAGHRHAHDYRFLVLVAEYDRLEGWKLAGHRSCAHAIHFNTGFALGACREKVRAARALERMPVTSRSMARGELSFSKVRALTRVVDDLHRERPEDEDKTDEEKAEARQEREAQLVEYARQGTTAEVERFIRSWRKLDRHGEAEAERQRHQSRYLWVRPDDEGMYRIRGRLDPEVGAVVMRAIEAAMDAAHARSDGTDSSDVPSTDWAPEGGPRGPKRRTITAKQKRADALGLLAEQAMAVGFKGEWGAGPDPDSEGEEDVPAEADVSSETGEEDRSHDEPVPPTDVSAETRSPDAGEKGSDGGSTCGCHTRFHGTRSERYQVFVHVDYDTLAGDGEPGRSHLEDGTRLSAETARRLTCDASLVEVIEAGQGATGGEASVGDDGSASNPGSECCDALARDGATWRTAQPLALGRKTRTIPPAIRRALYLRDGGCRFPGCGVRFTQGHHVKHWALGGKTELANLVSLCRIHHRAVHEDGFAVRRTRDGDFRFFDRRGWPLPQRPRATGVGRVVGSRFEGARKEAADGAAGSGKESGEEEGRRSGAGGKSNDDGGPKKANRAPGQSPGTLEESNRELGINPRWHTAAARFSGNVDDPRNSELRDLMFGAMDALDPAEDGVEPDGDGLEPAEDGLKPAEDGIEPAEAGIEPAEDGPEPGEDDSPDGP